MAVLSALAGVSLVGACAGVDRTTTRTNEPEPTDTTAVSAGSDSGTGASTSTTTAPPTGPPGSQLGSGKPVTLVFGGDIHYDGPLAARLESAPSTMLDGLQPALTEADLAVVNLETAIGTGGDKAAKAFNFRAPPAAFAALTGAGVDVLAMANNHALDYGQTGLAETLAAAEAMKAPVVGIGVDEAEALAPFTTTIQGQRIAVINATAVLDSNLITDWTATPGHPGVASAKRVEQLTAAVAAVRRDADTVIVFLHWGTEKAFCADERQRALAPALVDAGADIVIGGHAHRVQGGGYLGHAFIGYGLGNLQFKTSSADARQTGLMRIVATGRRIDSAEWLPARINGEFLPVLLGGAEAAQAQQAWAARRECSGLAATPTSSP